MLIALDYDETYTADPALWEGFISMALARGHEVVCVTMRHEHEPTDAMRIPVIYTSRKAKVPFMTERGDFVDIWIDDRPHWLLNDG